MHVILIEISNMIKTRQLLGQHFQILTLADSWLGAVHKKRTQSAGQEGCPVPTFFG